MNKSIFPTQTVTDSRGAVIEAGSPGMTLRQYTAIKIAASLLPLFSRTKWTQRSQGEDQSDTKIDMTIQFNVDEKELAKMAVAISDALLKELS